MAKEVLKIGKRNKVNYPLTEDQGACVVMHNVRVD